MVIRRGGGGGFRRHAPRFSQGSKEMSWMPPSTTLAARKYLYGVWDICKTIRYFILDAIDLCFGIP